MTLLASSDDSIGEGPDGSDKPPPTLTSKPPLPRASAISISSLAATTTITPASSDIDSLVALTSATTMTSAKANGGSKGQQSFPLPPPDAGTYEHKQPGHTRSTLQKLVAAIPIAEYKGTNQNNIWPRNTKQRSMSSTSRASRDSDFAIASNDLSSPLSSPTDSDWAISAPPSAPPTRPGSRAPSMSAGVSGNKVATAPIDIKGGQPAKDKDGVPRTPSGKNGKPSSVHSDHKFSLKDLIPSTPKLGRKISQRSTDSRKSDSEPDAVNVNGKARSNAGDSTASLSQKYGVCQKVAIGKGATSVVRLAHKWDRTEEKLYAVKVSFDMYSSEPSFNAITGVSQTSQE